MTQLSSSRRPIIAGNWKLNPSTVQEAENLLKLLSANFLNNRDISSSHSSSNTEVVIFPPAPYLQIAIDTLEGTGIKVGAQNIGLESKGAFTGEIAACMISSLGCAYVMLGHSERRTLFEESDEIINKKVLIALEQPNLNVILCVGETLA